MTIELQILAQKIAAQLKPFELMVFKKTFYHGSIKPITNWTLKADGRYGSGIYLTPDIKIAEFYGRGGRQGSAGQKLGQKGFIYKFEIAGKALKINSEEKAAQEMVGDFAPAEESFSLVGDLLSKKVTRHFGEWAKDEFDAHIVWFAEKESSPLAPLPQVLITDMSVIKSIKQAA